MFFEVWDSKNNTGKILKSFIVNFVGMFIMLSLKFLLEKYFERNLAALQNRLELRYSELNVFRVDGEEA